MRGQKANKQAEIVGGGVAALVLAFLLGGWPAVSALGALIVFVLLPINR